MKMKLYEVTHVVYEDDCTDPFHQKERRTTVGIFKDTKDKIKSLVAQLNKTNNSYHATENEPSENYYFFSEIRPISVDEYLASTKTSVGSAINPDKTESDLKAELLKCGLSPEELDWLEP